MPKKMHPGPCISIAQQPAAASFRDRTEQNKSHKRFTPHNVTRNVGLKMLDLRQLMFIPTTCWRRQSVTGLKSKSVPDLRDQLHTLHTVHIVVQWLYNKMYNIHCNLCWLYNLLAPQGARGGLAFYVGSNPLFLVHCDFECVAVLPPSAICDGILFDLSRQYFTFEPCSVVTNTVQRISLRGTSLQYAQLLAHSCRAWPNKIRNNTFCQKQNTSLNSFYTSQSTSPTCKCPLCNVPCAF